MGTTNHPVTGQAATPRVRGQDADDLAEAIADSRGRIDGTLEELHQRLNPRVLKEEVLEQLREGKDAIKEEFRAEFRAAKEALSVEVREAKERIIESAKTDISDAKDAFQEATIGKIETMVQNTQDSVKNAGRSLVTTIKENPVPAALVGLGLFWMFQSSREKRHASPSGFPFSDEGSLKARASSGGAGTGAHTMQSAFSRATHAAGESIADAASSVKHSVSGAARGASRGISELAHDAGAAGERLGHRTETFFDESPVAVGAAVLVTGALVGLAIPISRKETEWMGEARHNLSERTGRMIEKAGAELHDGAEKAAGEFRESLERKANGVGDSQQT